MREPKIILLDIETLPDLQAALKHWCRLSDFPGKTLKASITSIICIGWKVYGEDKTHCLNAWDYPEWSQDVNQDKPLLQDFLRVIEDADAIVTHNGKKFDYKHIQTRLMKHKLPPMPKLMHIDTCQVAKSNLYLINNKLNTVAHFLTKEEKLQNGGWDLWVDTYHRKRKAMRLMTQYCKQDVIALEAVFKELKSFVTLPNHNLYTQGDQKLCPNCGSTRLKSHGLKHTKTNTYRRLRCRDCQTFSRTDLAGRMPRTV